SKPQHRDTAGVRAGVCASTSRFPDRSAGPPMMERAMVSQLRWIVPVVMLSGLVVPVRADVITDWNEKAVAFVTTRNMLPPPADRTVAAMHGAMFDAINSIEHRYKPYLAQFPAGKDASQQAAAATAAARTLAALHPGAADEINAMLAAYLKDIPAGPARDEGVKLGQAVAKAI